MKLEEGKWYYIWAGWIYIHTVQDILSAANWDLVTNVKYTIHSNNTNKFETLECAHDTLLKVVEINKPEVPTEIEAKFLLLL